MNDYTRYSKILIEGMRTKTLRYIRVTYLDPLYPTTIESPSLVYDYKPIGLEEFYGLRRLLKKEMTSTVGLSQSEIDLLEKLGFDLTKDFVAESSYLALEIVK